MDPNENVNLDKYHRVKDFYATAWLLCQPGIELITSIREETDRGPVVYFYLGGLPKEEIHRLQDEYFKPHNPARLMKEKINLIRSIIIDKHGIKSQFQRRGGVYGK